MLCFLLTGAAMSILLGALTSSALRLLNRDKERQESAGAVLICWWHARGEIQQTTPTLAY